MSDATIDTAVTTKRIELTVSEEAGDLADARHRERLLRTVRKGLAGISAEDITVLDSYPDYRKVLLGLPVPQADAFIRAVKTGEFREEGIVDAFVCPTGPARETDIEFERKPMVRWFTPIELVRAGTKAVLSTLFGSYADRREVQALQAAESADLRRQAADGRGGTAGSAADTVFSESSPDRTRLDDVIAREICDYSDRQEVWIDYIADLGDGWNPTYTMARLLGEARLRPRYEGRSFETRRGDVLVMGGDQVYPTATREEYNNRLVGPYRASLPCVIGQNAPKLFAIPGNHDWYDGLTSFTRLFCQQRWIGGWQTEQVRSYFAIKLPHDWWLWGIDVQLESDIDLPQFNYFQTLARHVEPGSKIILCTAEPSWVYAEQKGEQAYQNLEYFERKIIRGNDLELVVGLAGDLHTYARYEETGGSSAAASTADDSAQTRYLKQRFIAGGGGAYLYPTHQLPERLDLPTGDPSRSDGDRVGADEPRDRYEQKSVFPDKASSRRKSYGALRLPVKNWKFAGVLGAFYLLFAWVTQSATKIPFVESDVGTSFIQRLENLPYPSIEGLGTMFVDFWIVLRHGPMTAIIVLLLCGGLVGFADKLGLKKVGLGIVHTLGHVFLALVLMWSFAELNLGVLNLPVEGVGQVLLFGVEMLVVGSLFGGILFGGYLLVSNGLLSLDREYEAAGTAGERGSQKLKGVHANEVFSSQSIPDYKNFLRLHIRENGDLAIYPIGVSEVCTSWRFNASAEPGRPWFGPESGTIDDRASMIEEPIVVSPQR